MAQVERFLSKINTNFGGYADFFQVERLFLCSVLAKKFDDFGLALFFGQ